MDTKEQVSYQTTKMQREIILTKLKEKGCRITKQRLRLIDIILQNECSSCKEIFYRALEEDDKLGVATVYRMVNLLEEIGAISRKNMYKVAYSENCMMENACTIELDDGSDTSSVSKKMEFRDPRGTQVLRIPRRPEGEQRDHQALRVCGTGMLRQEYNK